jgi:TetR/AcrR family transcriptional regulator
MPSQNLSKTPDTQAPQKTGPEKTGSEEPAAGTSSRDKPVTRNAGKAKSVQEKSGHIGRRAVRLDNRTETTTPKLAAGPAKRKVRGATKRSREVRGRILNAALECFGAFGFEGTSTRAVADRAGVTHTLVLYHFQSKEQLWIAAVDSALAAYTAAMTEHLEATSDGTAAESLRCFIEQFTRMSAEKPQVHRILTMESNQGTSRLNWVVDHYLRDHFEKITSLIRDGQREGVVRQCDAARLYYMIIGASGTPFTLSTEYKALTGRDVFSQTEVLRNIAFLYELVFIDAP